MTASDNRYQEFRWNFEDVYEHFQQVRVLAFAARE